MTPRPFTGLRVLLVAAFNRRYHRSALSLASALKSLGCEVQRCEERWRGVNRILRRPLAGRLAARLRRAPVDVVLVFKRSEEHTSELQSRGHLVCRLLLEKKKKNKLIHLSII